MIKNTPCRLCIFIGESTNTTKDFFLWWCFFRRQLAKASLCARAPYMFRSSADSELGLLPDGARIATRHACPVREPMGFLPAVDIFGLEELLFRAII